MADGLRRSQSVEGYQMQSLAEANQEMADTSYFTLEWEVDPSDPGLAKGKVESKVFEERGFKWKFEAVRRPDPNGGKDKADIILRCDVNHKKAWRCEGVADMGLLNYYGNSSKFGFEDRHFCFNENIRSWRHESQMLWNCQIERPVHLHFYIEIISSERELIAEPRLFHEPNSRSDVILLVGDKKLHVSKELLAIHSPVFETMFFGDFVESGKDEIEIKDVEYSEFLDLLQLIYLRTMTITDHNVSHILKLADQFEIKCLMDLAVVHLKQSSLLDTLTKLQLADKYRLTSVKEHCLLSFTDAAELTKILKSSSETANFSTELKAEMFDRLMKL